MRYAAEIERIERRIKIGKRIALIVCVCLVAALCVLSAFFSASSWKYRVSLPAIPARKSGEMRLHFINVGQGDATLIEFPDGQNMLVDGGSTSDTSVNALMRYLNALKIETIDQLVITHADNDHYGGIFTVAEQKKIGKAFLPRKQETLNTSYAKLYAALIEKGVSCVYTARNTRFEVTESVKAVCLYPYAMAEIEEDASSVLWLDYMGVSVLLTGDATAETETLLIRDDKLGALSAYGAQLTSTEILKVAHHGSEEATDEAFVEYIGAETAVISCGANNAYGHPSATVCDTLAAAGVATYRTDVSGHILLTIRADGTYTVENVAA